jgi:hypothetical protein
VVGNFAMSETYYQLPSRSIDLSSILAKFNLDLDILEDRDTAGIETQLLESQYSYIKLGLLLQKVRSGKIWEFCQGQYQNFRHFCQQLLGINDWQALNIIKAANVAIQLFEHGYQDLPRNPSQAIELAGLGLERMVEVWDKVTADTAAHRITAAVIKSQVHPDAQPSKASISLPIALRDKIAAEALELGISSAEYLERLVNGEVESQGRVVESPEISQADRDAIDKLEQTWIPNPNTQKSKPPRSTPPTIAEVQTSVVEGFDNLMNSILGGFVRPRPARS